MNRIVVVVVVKKILFYFVFLLLFSKYPMLIKLRKEKEKKK